MSSGMVVARWSLVWLVWLRCCGWAWSLGLDLGLQQVPLGLDAEATTDALAYVGQQAGEQASSLLISRDFIERLLVLTKPHEVSKYHQPGRGWGQDGGLAATVWRGEGEAEDEGLVNGTVLLPGLGNCRQCLSTLALLKRLSTFSPRPLVSSLVAACNRFKIEDPDVCRGAIESQGPILAAVLKRMSARQVKGDAGQLLCSARLGLCDYPDLVDARLRFPERTRKSRTERLSAWLSTWSSTTTIFSARPFQVLHLSDWHFDQDYVRGSEANCSKPMCCRDYSQSLGQKSRHSPQSVSKETVQRPASAWGDYKCDAPLRLGQDALRDLNKRVRGSETSFDPALDVRPELSFGILSGDVPPHDVWLSTPETALQALNTSFRTLKQGLGDVPLFHSLGNHEISPVNVFKPDAKYFDSDAGKGYSGQDNTDTDYLYRDLAQIWSENGEWLNERELKAFVDLKGSYTVRPRLPKDVKTSLKIIALNSMWGYAENWWLYIATEQVDVQGSLQWLIDQLSDSENLGEKVWIVMHASPSTTAILPSWGHAFAQIITRFHDTIAAQFYGHSHMDEVTLWYDAQSSQNARRHESEVRSIGYVGPSVTPFTNLNPGYRLYAVDPVTLAPRDAVTIVADLSRAAEWDKSGSRPDWHVEYSTYALYNPNVERHGSTAVMRLSPQWWHRFTQAILEEESKTALPLQPGKEDGLPSNLAEQYTYLARKGAGRVRRCNETCRRRLVCGMRASEPKAARACYVLKNETKGMENVDMRS